MADEGRVPRWSRLVDLKVSSDASCSRSACPDPAEEDGLLRALSQETTVGSTLASRLGFRAAAAAFVAGALACAYLYSVDGSHRGAGRAASTGYAEISSSNGVATISASEDGVTRFRSRPSVRSTSSDQAAPGQTQADNATGAIDRLTHYPFLELDLKAICSFSRGPPDVTPRKTWAVPDWQQDKCYSTVMRQAQREANSFSALQSAREGRNWCWVGLKEYGCHNNIIDLGRPHLSWEEMGWKASWIVPGPQSWGGHWPLMNPEVCDRREIGAKRVWTAEEWHTAWVWFSHHVKVYAVNMKGDTERWSLLTEHLTQLHIPVTRVPGVDMREEGALADAKLEGLVPQDYNFSRAQEEASMAYQSMGGIAGTVGCASAHFRAQTTAYMDARAPMALVLEDDARLADDFVPQLWSLVRDELPCDWQVLSLRSMCPFGTCVSKHLARVQPDVNEPEDRCRHGVNYGFQGVLYRIRDLPDLQEKWKGVVFNETRPHCLDIDVALASMSGTIGFYAVPFVQYPGFLTERREGSSRWMINNATHTL